MPCPQPKTPAGSSNPHPIRHAVHAVSDQVEYLHDTHQAYEALEMLVTPVGAHDDQRLELDRSQLGCLLRVLNRRMRDDIRQAMCLVATAREAV